MNQRPNNPFASPETESEDEYETNLSGGESLFRWMMLSTISGALLFGTFSFLASALAFVILIPLSGETLSLEMFMQSTPIIAGYLLAVTLYSMLGGTILGILSGIFWYLLRFKLKSILPMTLLGSVFSVLVLIGPLVLFYEYQVIDYSPLIVLWFGLWSLGIVIAVWRLNLNIHKYLLSPLSNDEDPIIASTVE